MKNIKPDWLKNRGYLHITSHENLHFEEDLLVSKIKNATYVSRHAFFPLIHSNIKERRYKRIALDSKKRAHSFKNIDGKIIKNYKNRPLHYATHIDAMIFGYYAEILLRAYEEKLLKMDLVSESVIAYRKKSIDNSDKNKSTIHFANEVFNEIKARSLYSEVCILKFDIKSFFSRIDHKVLKEAWASLINEKGLPKDHYNVFKASTKFSYIMLDDLRMQKNDYGRRCGFDEKRLANNTTKGIQAFFESPTEMREKIKNGEIKLHRFPFRNELGSPVGIPQGLPISAVLANVYLLNFDIAVIEKIVKSYNTYYRRYSDDIIVICERNQALKINSIINNLIIESKVEISKEKSEKFIFSQMTGKQNELRLTSIKDDCDKLQVGVPFTYLGFEFYGYKTLIKSQNLAKFYRRMIVSVKSKCNRAKKLAADGININPIIYRRQLYRLYTTLPLNAKKTLTNKKWLIKNDLGNYVRQTKPIQKKHRSNYFSYVNRASLIMGEPAIALQTRNHMKIFNSAIRKHLK